MDNMCPKSKPVHLKLATQKELIEIYQEALDSGATKFKARKRLKQVTWLIKTCFIERRPRQEGTNGINTKDLLISLGV